MNFNKVIIGGRLTRDVEMRFLPNGTAVGSFGLAINRAWTAQDGSKKEECTFVDVTAFGKQAEVIAQYVKKGQPIFLSCRLRTESWDDKSTGQKRSKLGVIVEEFQFIGGRREEGDAPQEQRPAPKTAEAPQTESEGEKVPF